MQMTILRFSAVVKQTGLSRSTLYNRIGDGLWPVPVNLGARAVGWPSFEVEVLNAARVAGKSNDAIRALVAQLVQGREASGSAFGVEGTTLCSK